jgi:hypothetical protein
LYCHLALASRINRTNCATLKTHILYTCVTVLSQETWTHEDRSRRGSQSSCESGRGRIISIAELLCAAASPCAETRAAEQRLFSHQATHSRLRSHPFWCGALFTSHIGDKQRANMRLFSIFYQGRYFPVDIKTPTRMDVGIKEII